MPAYRRTRLLLAVVLGTLLAYEAWVLVTRQPRSTISEVFWDFARFPLVPFIVGVLCGHFFWQRSDVYDNPAPTGTTETAGPERAAR